MSCRGQNFRLLNVSNLSVRNFRIFLVMYPGSVHLYTPSEGAPHARQRCAVRPCGAAWSRRMFNDYNFIEALKRLLMRDRHGIVCTPCWTSPGTNADSGRRQAKGGLSSSAPLFAATLERSFSCAAEYTYSIYMTGLPQLYGSPVICLLASNNSIVTKPCSGKKAEKKRRRIYLGMTIWVTVKW